MTIAEGIVKLLGMKRVKQNWIKVPKTSIEALKNVEHQIVPESVDRLSDNKNDDLLVGFVDGSALFVDRPGCVDEVCCAL